MQTNPDPGSPADSLALSCAFLSAAVPEENPHYHVFLINVSKATPPF